MAVHLKTLFWGVIVISLVCIVFYGMNNLPSKVCCSTAEHKIISTRNSEIQTADSLPIATEARNVILTKEKFVNTTSEPASLHTITKHKHPRNPKQTCSPINHVLFLKTHKTGGSTITNILNRELSGRSIYRCLRQGLLSQEKRAQEERILCQSMMKNELSYVKYFRERMNKQVRNIEEPDEYLDDPKNDWEAASDLEHDPILSGVESSSNAAAIMERPVAIQGEAKNS
ncbi:hypothetical protein OS493_027972 [Desmophyllum pertusum]|uniref:Uncharacterized protein n=1 Tax=Desmophyllum pertusum TaxID=174260 RepID=A0A9W9Y9P3_9CNID|nr:hypothetical protein OS493_027972 [Desmophyllum pertusum]